MRIQNTSLSAALLAGAMLAAPAQAETVMTFKSAGVSMFNAENFNLSDGSIVQIELPPENRTVTEATI